MLGANRAPEPKIHASKSNPFLVRAGPWQCSKLTVHTAPGVQHLAAGCTHFDTCAPGECTLFQSISIHHYRYGHKENLSGA